MTKKDIDKILEEIEDEYDRSSLVAGKLIRLDIFQMGIDNWLEQEASDVAREYVDIADIAMNTVVGMMQSQIAGEQLLDDLGIGQSHRFDVEEIEKFRESVLDTFRTLATYLQVLEIAKQKNNENRCE